MTLWNKKGFGLLEAVIGGVIILVGVLYFSKSMKGSADQHLQLKDTLQADALASELLDFFRAHSSGEWITYFKTVPVAANPYFLCAHINLLNRENGKILNPHGLAELPPAILKEANRYYQIHVVDLKTMSILRDPFCSRTAANMPVLIGDQRLLVTVGLSWRPLSGQGLKNVVLSTVLPQ